MHCVLMFIPQLEGRRLVFGQMRIPALTLYFIGRSHHASLQSETVSRRLPSLPAGYSTAETIIRWHFPTYRADSPQVCLIGRSSVPGGEGVSLDGRGTVLSRTPTECPLLVPCRCVLPREERVEHATSHPGFVDAESNVALIASPLCVRLHRVRLLQARARQDNRIGPVFRLAPSTHESVVRQNVELRVRNLAPTMDRVAHRSPSPAACAALDFRFPCNHLIRVVDGILRLT